MAFWEDSVKVMQVEAILKDERNMSVGVFLFPLCVSRATAVLGCLALVYSRVRFRKDTYEDISTCFFGRVYTQFYTLC